MTGAGSFRMKHIRSALSPMEACVVICRAAKPKARKGKVLFINAVNEVTRERAQSFLTDDHIERIVQAYEQFKDEPGLTRVASLGHLDGKSRLKRRIRHLCGLDSISYERPNARHA